MKAVLDGCCLGRRKTGNETYVRGLLQGFEALDDPDLDLTVLTTDRWQGERSPRFTWQPVPLGTFVNRNYWTLPREVRRLGGEIYHPTYWARFWDGLPYVVTIHDVSFVDHPEFFRTSDRVAFATLVRAAARKARRVLTGSEFSKQRICESWKIPEERVSVVANGCESDCVPDPRAPEEPYLLFVGNLHPRKNLARLIEALALLKRERGIRERLKVVGRKAWPFDGAFEAARRHGVEEDVEFLGYVSRKDLIRLYQRATAFVNPSLYEGFGLPVLEAMGCGCPVVASNSSAIPEVAGDAAVLVDVHRAEDLAEGIWMLLSSPELRWELRERGRLRHSQFRWEDAARETLEAYRRALA